MPAQESPAVTVALRKAISVLWDDLLAVVRKLLNPNLPRPSLHRSMLLHGAEYLRNLYAMAPKSEVPHLDRLCPRLHPHQ
jgi:hypothetical protein